MDLVEKTHNNKRHPWELSRSYSVLKLLDKNPRHTIYADIGSGDQFFISQLQKLTNQKIYAVDIAYLDEVAENKGIVSLKNISTLEDNSIDCLVAMDILEHVENDEELLAEMHRKLKKDGRILITVPAMQFLFSSHDVFLKHYRRYNRKQISQKIKKDFVLEKSFYFYSSLLLLRMLLLGFEAISKIQKKNVGVGLWKYEEKTLITRFFFILLNIDFYFCKTFANFKIYLPGLSLLAIARKK